MALLVNTHANTLRWGLVLSWWSLGGGGLRREVQGGTHLCLCVFPSSSTWLCCAPRCAFATKHLRGQCPLCMMTFRLSHASLSFHSVYCTARPPRRPQLVPHPSGTPLNGWSSPCRREAGDFQHTMGVMMMIQSFLSCAAVSGGLTQMGRRSQCGTQQMSDEEGTSEGPVVM